VVKKARFKTGISIPPADFLPYSLLIQRMIKDCFRSGDTENCQSCTIKALGFNDVCETVKRMERRTTLPVKAPRAS
jgi:hypothetical protein